MAAAAIRTEPSVTMVQLLLQVARPDGTFDAAAARDDRVCAFRPIDGIFGGRREQRQQPMQPGAELAAALALANR